MINIEFDPDKATSNYEKHGVSVDYDFSNAKPAMQIPHLNRLREQHKMLDEDVSQWLVLQDSSTKQHISEMIRQVMALKGTQNPALA